LQTSTGAFEYVRSVEREMEHPKTDPFLMNTAFVRLNWKPIFPQTCTNRSIFVPLGCCLVL
ncbi:hypothetical protein KIN20_028886, partial [Parelaphostrongylus tenuis]